MRDRATLGSALAQLGVAWSLSVSGCGASAPSLAGPSTVPSLALARDCEWSARALDDVRVVACSGTPHASSHSTEARAAATLMLTSLLALGERHEPRVALVGVGAGHELTQLLDLGLDVELHEEDRELLRLLEWVAPTGTLAFVDGVPSHPRLTIVDADGAGSERYDLVIHSAAEAHAAMPALFFRARLAEAVRRLADGGVLAMSVRVHAADRREIQRAMATFLAEVPGEVVAVLPENLPSLLLLIGSNGTLVMDPETLGAREPSASYRALLEAAHRGSAAELLGSVAFADRREMSAWIGEAPPYPFEPIAPASWPAGPEMPAPGSPLDGPEWAAWQSASDASWSGAFDVYELTAPDWHDGMVCPDPAALCPLMGRAPYGDEMLAMARGSLRFGRYAAAGELLSSVGDAARADDLRDALHLIGGELPALDLFELVGRGATTLEELTLKTAWDAAIAGGEETNGWVAALARLEASRLAAVDDPRIEYARTYAAVRGEWTSDVLERARTTLERIGPAGLPGYWALLARVRALLRRPDAAIDAAERAVAEGSRPER